MSIPELSATPAPARAVAPVLAVPPNLPATLLPNPVFASLPPIRLELTLPIAEPTPPKRDGLADSPAPFAAVLATVLPPIPSTLPTNLLATKPVLKAPVIAVIYPSVFLTGAGHPSIALNTLLTNLSILANPGAICWANCIPISLSKALVLLI